MYYGANEAPKTWQLRGVSSGTTYNPSDSNTYTIISNESNQTWTGFVTNTTPSTNDITNKTRCNEYLVDNPGSYIQYILHVTDVLTAGLYPAIGQMAYYSSTSTSESFTLSGSVSQKFDIFMIGGGGSGGKTWAGGGGGAGSAVLAKDWSITVSYTHLTLPTKA